MRIIALAPLLLLSACPPPTKSGDPPNQNQNPTQPSITAPTPLPSADMRAHPAAGSTWTVLVYMVADNDLEPFALQDLTEMAAVGSAAGLEILVQADRSTEYSSAPVLGLANFTSTKRLRVTAGGLTEIADLGELNMGDPTVLSDFIDWGVKQKASDRYAIVFWDHGGAWPGFGGDGSTANHDSLTLAELQSGLQNGLTKSGLSQFALIGFDACLMATYETAMVVRPFGEYLLASEELEPGHGWDWAKLSVLKNTPTTSPAAFGEALIDGFFAQAAAEDTQESVTLSLVDLYALDPLHAAVTTLADSVRSNVKTLAPALGRERAGTLRFGDNPDPKAAANMVDLGLFVSGLAAKEPSLATVAQSMSTALTKAVVKSRTGAGRKGATGLSIYLPPIDAYKTDYGALSEVIKGWQRLLSELSGAPSSGQLGTPPSFTGGAIDQWAAGGVRVHGDLNAGGGPTVATATLTGGTVDSTNLYALVEIPATVTGDTVRGEWAASVLTLTQGGTSDYGFLSLSTRDGYQTALVPLAYTRSGATESDLTAMLIVFDPSGNEASRTFYLFSDSGPGELTPEPGSTLAALMLVQPLSGGAASWQLTGGGTFDATQPITLDVEPLAQGTNVGVVLSVSDVGERGDLLFFSQAL